MRRSPVDAAPPFFVELLFFFFFFFFLVDLGRGSSNSSPYAPGPGTYQREDAT